MTFTQGVIKIARKGYHVNVFKDWDAQVLNREQVFIGSIKTQDDLSLMMRLQPISIHSGVVNDLEGL